MQFSAIIDEYRSQPQADPRVCYEVALAGGATGDLVGFYNSVFVPVMGPFIQRLAGGGAAATTAAATTAAATTAAASGAVARGDGGKAAGIDLRAHVLPLPAYTGHRVHSPRKVGRNSALTVAPISASRLSTSQALNKTSPEQRPSTISYAFHQSPSKNLEVINLHLRRQADAERSPPGSAGAASATGSSRGGKRPLESPPSPPAFGSAGGVEAVNDQRTKRARTAQQPPLGVSSRVAEILDGGGEANGGAGLGVGSPLKRGGFTAATLGPPPPLALFAGSVAESRTLGNAAAAPALSLEAQVQVPAAAAAAAAAADQPMEPGRVFSDVPHPPGFNPL
jgi:hypothetical protein